MRSHRPQFVLTIAGSMLLAACGGCGEGQGSDPAAKATLAPSPSDGGGVVNVGGKLFSIPSPVETALMIRKAGLAYQKELPLATEKADALTTIAEIQARASA